MKRIAVLVLMGLFALVGCSTTKPTPSLSSQTLGANPAVAVVASALGCDATKASASPSDSDLPGATGELYCVLDGVEYNVVTFGSAQSRKDAVSVLNQQAHSANGINTIMVGPTWIVQDADSLHVDGAMVAAAHKVGGSTKTLGGSAEPRP